MVAYWGMGLYWGKAMSQNRKSHLIGHIKDIKGDPADPLTRIYTTSLAQPYHSDVSDIVGASLVACAVSASVLCSRADPRFALLQGCCA